MEIIQVGGNAVLFCGDLCAYSIFIKNVPGVCQLRGIEFNRNPFLFPWIIQNIKHPVWMAVLQKSDSDCHLLVERFRLLNISPVMPFPLVNRHSLRQVFFS